MKITVVGIGYVGMSMAVLLAQNSIVTCYDISKEKLILLKKRKTTVVDNLIKRYLKKPNVKIKVVDNEKSAFTSADLVIICTPTNYDDKSNKFNTSSVDLTIKKILKFNKKALIVIKSTIPVGYTDKIIKKYNYKNIFFSPEFLREGKALYDNLYPSRIVIGSYSKKSSLFSNLLLNAAKKNKTKIPVLHMSSKEAESVKLFANAFLAMRVAFFNELDSFSEIKKINSKNIIEGIGYDNRIGNYYNNPSFGYGGYCLPKDTKQLLANYENIPNELIKAVVKANSTRKDFISNIIIRKKPKIVGIFRIVMKKGSDNFRSSAIQGIMKRISSKKIKVIIYEPLIKSNKYLRYDNILDLKKFKKISDIILTNRNDDELNDVKKKVYSRDLFNSN